MTITHLVLYFVIVQLFHGIEWPIVRWCVAKTLLSLSTSVHAIWLQVFIQC